MPKITLMDIGYTRVSENRRRNKGILGDIISLGKLAIFGTAVIGAMGMMASVFKKE